MVRIVYVCVVDVLTMWTLCGWSRPGILEGIPLVKKMVVIYMFFFIILLYHHYVDRMRVERNIVNLEIHCLRVIDFLLLALYKCALIQATPSQRIIDSMCVEFYRSNLF